MIGAFETNDAPIQRVVVWGNCDTGKPRVRILLDGLRRNGVQIIECRNEVWQEIQDKSQVKGINRWLSLLTRVLLAYPVLIWRYLRLPSHDWVLLGYPAIPDIFVIRLFTWLRRTPVAMDWFLSAYDTVVQDRRLVGKNHPLAWILRATEWVAVRLPDAIFMDTKTHARRMERLFGLRKGRCGSVWVGMEDHMFSRHGNEARGAGSHALTRVLFYGQLIPLHGVGTIMEAARILRNQPIEWLIIGRGQDAAIIHAQLDAAPLPMLRWVEWVEYESLMHYIAEADICLGIFGTSDKAASVIPNKAFQILAAGKPLITMDSQAMRELVTGSMTDVLLIPPADAPKLAEAIMHWMGQPPAVDPLRPTIRTMIAPAAIGAQCLRFLRGAAH